ncbi:MAG: hypothetical protein HFH05_10380 [Lachnospiraceae bacterium]|nr:hypothetical protein [Lachnospiraceae bacterium]MCI9674275.1 hypothetical protein [Lachnospiraceae bacterium]
MREISGKDLLIRDLKKKLRKLEIENGELRAEIGSIRKERDYIQYCLDETRKSFSYRLGYLITTIPRKLRKPGK